MSRFQSFLTFAICFLIFSQGSSLTSWSQTSEATSRKVTGQLIDPDGKQIISYGTVFLKNNQTQKQFTLNTDSLGGFNFPNIPLGSYTFKAFYAGYPQLSKDLVIQAGAGPYNLGKISMVSETKEIGEITIKDYKDLIEQRPDGLIYNAEDDATNKGTSASEVMRKVPMVTVDEDDNMELRGNGNIKVLIDGKPAAMVASNVSDLLKQMPSDQIKSVQVVTSPGAKYDAEGSAGVINIITKKSQISGFSGRVFTGLNYNFNDKRVNGYGGINLNFRKNKFGISADLGGGRWSYTSTGTTRRIDHPGSAQESRLDQSTFSDGDYLFMWGRISADYTIDSLSSVSAGFGLRPGGGTTDLTQSTLFPAYGLDYTQNTHENSPRYNYSVNASYNKRFKNHPERSLDLLGLYTMNGSHADYELEQANVPGSEVNYQEQNDNQTKNNELTLQSDYAHPLKQHNQKIETGLKYINRAVGSEYELLTWTPSNGNAWELDPIRTNRLDYIQQVASAYGQFTSDITQKLSVVAGLRYEFTDIQANLRDNGGSFESDYHNILPSAILSYKLGKSDRLNLSYTQRIERPSIQFINPYINSSDPLNISTGNPGLGPERIHKVELNYNTVLGRSSLNLASFYSHTNSGIEAFTDINSDGAAYTTYGNFAKNNTIGLNVFGSTTMWGRWRINLNGNVYHKSLTGQNISNAGWQYDTRLSTDIQLINNLSISGFGMYRGRTILLQGTRSGWYRYSLGLKQSILKGKGDISLSAVNFLSATTNTVSEFTYDEAIFRNVSYRNTRGIRLGFNYSFGQMKFQKPKKQIQNTDLKSDTERQEESGEM